MPRIDVDGYGALELTFRIAFDGEYRLILESANETSESISNSGVFNPVDQSIAIDEVELDTGDVYAVTLALHSQDGQIIFNILDAVHLNPSADPPDSPPTEFPAETIALYNQQCANCHAEDGTGTETSPTLVACANCGNSSSLATYIRDTMPLGLPTVCDIDCANDMAAYIIGAFNASNEETATETVGFVQLLDNITSLRRASQQLVSRLPTMQELQLVSTSGDEGLRQVIDGMLEEDAFYERLVEIWNDYLLTDKYHSRNGSEAAISLLSSSEYPNRRWFDPGSENRPENYSELRRNTNNGIAREPLELINHVVRNNLPFTEILTANYMMLNPFSAQSYGLSIPFENPDDPNEYKPGGWQHIPYAGILTSPMFLNRYPTTSTNRNRGRARVIYDIFLDTDVLALEGQRPGNAVDIDTPVPTINNPACNGCHSVVDPVASVLQDWDYKGRYRPRYITGDNWYSDMLPPGFNGVTMPLEGNIDSKVQWLAQQIVADPRFSRAVMRIMVNGLTGKEPLRAPTDADASQAEMDAYVAERTVLNDIQTSFVNNNFNLKVLVRELMMTPYWRAGSIEGGAASEAHALTGSSYLLSPEQLDRKIESLLGIQWRRSMDSYYKDVDSSWSHQLGRNYHQIYGGIDSDSIVTRLKSPNGLMGAMQLRMANELACYAIPHDFWLPEGQRRLFLFVDHETNPYNEAGAIDNAVMEQIRRNIQYLHDYLLNERLPLGHEELQITEQLFMSSLNRGRQVILAGGGEWYDTRLPSDCDRTRDLEGNELDDVNGEDLRLYRDNQYIIRAWMAVAAYLLADYKFVYSY